MNRSHDYLCAVNLSYARLPAVAFALTIIQIKMGSPRFDVFVFQFMPLSPNQTNLFADAMAEKNNVFESILQQVRDKKLRFTYRNRIYQYEPRHYEDGYLIFQIASSKIVRYERDFRPQKLESAPSCAVIIANDPNTQMVFIESSEAAFLDSDVVANIMRKSFEKLLAASGLTITIDPTFEADDFWQLVDEHRGEISYIKFEFKFPNLAYVSDNLPDELKAAAKSVLAETTKVQFTSANGNTLNNVERSNQQIAQFVQASADGATRPSIKFKNVRSEVVAGEHKKTIEIGEMEFIDYNNPSDVTQVLSFLKQAIE